jgi:hypothetical protein
MSAKAKLQTERINIRLTILLRARFVFPVAVGQVSSLLLIHMVLFSPFVRCAPFREGVNKKTVVPTTGTTVFCHLELLTGLNITRCIHYVPNRENTLKCTTKSQAGFLTRVLPQDSFPPAHCRQWIRNVSRISDMCRNRRLQRRDRRGI